MVLCFGLVLYRDGTLAELFSQRMSHREKVFIACVFVGLFAVISMMGEAKQREPFALHEARADPREGVGRPGGLGRGLPAGAGPGAGGTARGGAARLSEYLGLERLPAVAVLPIRELDADVFQRAKLEKADGVVVRANLAAPDFDPRAFEAFLFREVLIQVSEGVVLREERQWLLDGFTTWWAHRSRQEERLAMRAAVASREGFDSRAWLTTRERFGPCLSGALAARGVQALHAQPRGARVPRTDAAHPGAATRNRTLGTLAGAAAGLAAARAGRILRGGAAAAWSEALHEDRETHAKELERLAGMTPSLALVAESAETFRLEHTLRAEDGRALPARYALLHHKLKPFENEVAAHELSRQDTVPSADGARLPLGLARGDQWLFVVQVESETLGCPIRLLAERREIR